MGAQAVRLSNVDIDNALENKDFEVLFQPIFDLGNGALARMETFIRWRHPSLGALPPGAFISFFESQGRMSELTRYVLNEALDAYEAWRGPYAPGFSINLALTDLADEGFTPHFIKQLRDRDFPAELVTLECPMPPVDTPLETASANFEELRKTGARLAIEVRGRANELLKNIDPFPFDEIKTGGASILRFARTVRGPGMSAISDLLDIANGAKAAIIAVGVEDQASLSALRGLGFTGAQGNHLAKVGGIADFRISRVNEVRELLDLPTLSQDELAALFRTDDFQSHKQPEAVKRKAEPTVKSASKTADDAPSADEGDVVDRLSKRLKTQNAKSETDAEVEDTDVNALDKIAEPSSDDVEDAEAADKAKKIAARKRAKALAIAKQKKLRIARKKAAIAKVKAQAADTNSDLNEEPSPVAEEELSMELTGPEPSPRDLQSRIAREFSQDETDENALPSNEDPQTDAAPIDTPAVEAPTTQAPTTEEIIDDATLAENAPLVETAPPDITPASVDVTATNSSSVAVESVQAHFLPTLNVAVNLIGSQNETPPTPQAVVPEQSAAKIDYNDPSMITGSLFDYLESDEAAGSDAPRPVTNETPNDDIPSMFRRPKTDENDEQPAVDVGDIAPKTRKPKNFLTRKYKLMPTHFWPKSWKRQYRKMRQRQQSQL